jgi:hypothetical protein
MPPRQRNNSTRQRGHPMPGMPGISADGIALIRQRVIAALGRSRSTAASPPVRQRRSNRPMTPERSAASCRRRLATIGNRPISPTTAASP